MKTYTAFFASNESLPESLRVPDAKPSDLRLVDGIAAEKQGDTFGFKLGSTKRGWFPFSSAEPPEIIANHVFSCELEESNGVVRITRSKGAPPRHYETEPKPVLLRVRTRSEELTEKRGLVTDLKGTPRRIFVAEGLTRLQDNHFARWSDELIVLTTEDVIQIRPSGTIEPVEWVVRYAAIGPTYQSLEDYLGKL